MLSEQLSQGTETESVQQAGLGSQVASSSDIQLTSYCSSKIGFGPRVSQMTSYHSSKIRLSSLITPYLATVCGFQLHNYFKPWDLKRNECI